MFRWFEDIWGNKQCSCISPKPWLIPSILVMPILIVTIHIVPILAMPLLMSIPAMPISIIPITVVSFLIWPFHNVPIIIIVKYNIQFKYIIMGFLHLLLSLISSTLTKLRTKISENIIYIIYLLFERWKKQKYEISNE